MPVGELLKRTSSRELMEWRAYFLVRQEMADEKANPKLKSVDDFRKAFGGKVRKE